MGLNKFRRYKKIQICLVAAFFAVGFFAFSNQAQAATPIFYSVGQNTTSHETGAGTVTVDAIARTATFSVVQTAVNMGVGDLVTYTGGSCYISVKNSTSVWGCQSATGGAPTAVTDAEVTSIAHAFASLSAAVTGASGLLGTSDLVAGDYQLNFPCYYDTGADTNATVSGYTTGASNYIKIYTPNNILTEVNSSQRHSGKWNDGKYKITVGDNNNFGIQLVVNFVRLEGIQISKTNSSFSGGGGVLFDVFGDIRISDNILKGISTGVYSSTAIRTSPAGAQNVGAISIWNNLLQDFKPNSGVGGNTTVVFGFLSGSTGRVNLYNNTIANCKLGFDITVGLAVAKNNLFSGCTNDFYTNQIYAAGSDYNVTTNATLGYAVTGAGNTHDKLSQSPVFVDAANKDFHLSTLDMAARNSGIDLSADASLAFNEDVDFQSRHSVWDVGADETVTPVYYSVGQSAADLKTGSPNITTLTAGAAILSEAQTGNIGVGDRVTYNGGQIAYISAKTNADGMHWSLVTATGDVPTDVSGATVDSIKHEYTSLSAAVTGAMDVNHLKTADLIAGNYQLNLPCYYDIGADPDAVTVSGYTTSANSYIKIYTPNNISTEANNSQRHQGKWDSGKYQLIVNNNHGISEQLGNVWIDGLQIQLTNVTSNLMGIYVTGSLGANANVKISDNILKGAVSTADWHMGIDIWNSSGSGVIKIWNNVIYDFKRTSGNNAVGIGIEDSYTYYIYNNTVYNCGVGINKWGGTAILKNNLVQNTGGNNYGGTFDATSSNNVSQDATAPGTNSKISTAVSFADVLNKDFHLNPFDIAAKNAGVDLSVDVGLAFNSDVEGQVRPSSSNATWDIGADEAATAIFYSVGQNTTDHKICTNGDCITNPLTVSIVGTTGVATFSVAQTANNLGVGDKVTYNTTEVAYISEKISTSQWKLITASGAIPADVTAQTVNSIAHAFASLSAAEAGAPALLGTADLVTGNFQLNFPCYYDSGADTTAVTVDGYVTGVSNYIKIYTPNNVGTEVNLTQRHSGRWDEVRYNLMINAVGDYTNALYLRSDYTKIDGLQIKVSNNDFDGIRGVLVGWNDLGRGSTVHVSNNIITENHTTTNNDGFEALSIRSTTTTGYIWNNLIYDANIGGNTGSSAMMLYYNHHYVYNNVVYNYTSGYGIRSNAGSVLAKNNIVQQASFNGAFDAASSNNISQDATSPNVALQNKTVSFLDAANKDFHLAPSDTTAKNAGADLSADPSFAFSADIDGQIRSASPGWDIGADEAATAIFYSVGQNTNDHSSGGNVSIASGIATFTVAQTATNLGVGDKLIAGSNTYFLASKIDTTHWKVVNNLGAVPADSSSTAVTSIAHVFSSLNSAATTANGASYLNTSNLYTGNYQLNLPCYYDSGADTTQVSLNAWQTAQGNMIKIYTPTNTATEVNVSQRHSGKWDDGKYRLIVSATADYSRAILFDRGYVWIDGLQIKSSNNDYGYSAGILVNYASANLGQKVYISNNIITENHVTTNNDGFDAINLYYATGYVWNNLIYDTNIGGGTNNSAIMGYYNHHYVYNNVIYNRVGYGIRSNDGSVLAKNNIVQQANFDGTFNAASSNNISQNTSSPNVALRNKTVTFADAANKDFHLASSDIVAKNAGADLSADANFAFATDIDGQARLAGTPPAGGWDIGADEAATAVYYSVGQSVANLMSGTPRISIAGGAAVISVAQTGNIGVGDRVTYNTNQIAYISAKTNADGMHWSLVTATGDFPDDVSMALVDSIKHEFTNLSTAVTGAMNPSHLNTNDLMAGNFQLNLPCYYDSGADTAAVSVSGYNTAVANYIKIYTPNNILTEANNSQRHQGKWDDGKYQIQITNGAPLTVAENYSKIEGLQIKHVLAGTSGWGYVMYLDTVAGKLSISNNIITADIAGVPTANSLNVAGIRGCKGDDSSMPNYIYNNIIYGVKGMSTAAGIELSCGGNGNSSYVYNNTLHDNKVGILLSYGEHFLKNNLMNGNGTDFIEMNSGLGAGPLGNISADGTSPNVALRNKTVAFADAANKDFHLSPFDTSAKNAGADLSADSNFAFNSDVDSQARSATPGWDIGADEAATAIFYSVGQNTNDHKTGTPTVTISSGIATFSMAQTATNMGVGDKVTYNTSSVAYIAEKISTTQWKLITNLGAVPADVLSAQTVNSIAHEFTSLTQAIGNGSNYVANISHLNTADFVVGNYQLNLPCYYDTGANTSGLTMSTNLQTSPSNYIKIYTPASTATEVNLSQRHSGKWDDTKFRIDVNGSFQLNIGYTVADGLQYDLGFEGVYVQTYPDEVKISNSIIKSSYGAIYGVRIDGASSKPRKAFVFNNIIYGMETCIARYYDGAGKTLYAYNNTVYDCNTAGINDMAGSSVIAKNNIVQASTNGYDGTFLAGSDYNVSDLAADAPGANSKNLTTVSFLDAVNKDFHLFATDTSAHDAGTDLSKDANFAFDVDIDGQGRINAWDIGADEFAETQTEKSAPAASSTESGLVGHWTFDGNDVNGDVANDVSGNNNNGTIIGSSPALGKLGQAMSFNGTGDGITTVDQDYFSPIVNDISMSFWAKVPSSTAPSGDGGCGGVGRYFMAKDDSGISPDWGFENDGNNKICFVAWQGSASNYGEISVGKTVNDDQWHHYIGTMSYGNKMELFIDGISVGQTTAFTGSMINSTKEVQFGRRGDGNFMAGLLDDVRIYSRALSTQEIGRLYNQGQIKVQAPQKAPNANGLIGSWSFDGNDVNATTVFDRSGNGNNGTIFGATPTLGKIGQAMSFNGTSDYVSMGDMNQADGLAAITTSVWMKFKVAGGGLAETHILDKSRCDGTANGGTFELGVSLFGARKAEFAVLPSNGVPANFVVSGAGTTSVDDANWHHLVGRYDGQNVSIWVDGVQENIANVGAFNLSSNNRSVELGGNCNGYPFRFNGDLDDVQIYNRALSAQEIGQLYKAGQVGIRK
ncbi:MAG: hypothetical protein HGA36_02795 [Candidatus Moranbacteria bacterium]|nr:hypothetical protein [Candidatus Moranbacteria bacterium]